MTEPDAARRDALRGATMDKITPEIIGARLAALTTGQSAMNGALGLMLDTLHVQTSLLRKLTEVAREEPSPSPVAKALGDLAGAVMEIDASVGALEKKFGELSEIIAAAFEIEINKAPPPAPNGKMV
jgi:hypothetical protein